MRGAAQRLTRASSQRSARAVSGATVQQRYAERDHLLSGFTPSLRVALAQATDACESGRARFSISSPRAAAVYARTLVAATLLSAFLKGEERVIVQFAGAAGAAVTQLYAEAVAVGEVRGSAAGAGLVRDAGPAWDGRLRGTFSVTRVLYGAATPVQGIVEAVAGDVEGDVAEYFARSEQRGAVVRTEAVMDAETGRIAYAGGVLVEEIALGGGTPLAPGTTQLADVARALVRAPPPALRGLTEDAGCGEPTQRALLLSELKAAGVSLAETAARIVPEFAGSAVESAAGKDPGDRRMGVLHRIPLDFHCRCTRANFTAKLVRTVSATMIDKMVSEAVDGVAATLTCAFCNTDHRVTTPELLHAQSQRAGA